MELPPTLLRQYYRARANPRASTDFATGSYVRPCDAGSRWQRAAFSRLDIGKTVVVTESDGVHSLAVDSVIRTELPSFDISIAGAEQEPYVICHVEEWVGGSVQMGSECVMSDAGQAVLPNPAIELASPDASITQMFEAGEAKVGLGRIVALYHRSSTSYPIH